MMMGFTPCPCRKLDPDVMMVQAAEDRQRENATLSPGQTSSAVSLWPKLDVSGCRCNTAGTSAAHDADAARRTRSHGRGTRGGWSRSVVQRNRSATAIVALSVCRECPSRECGA